MKQTYTVHSLTCGMRDAYDFTQYSDTIKDGDVLCVPDGIAIMFKAWPCMVLGTSAVFHNVEPTEGEVSATWMRFTLESWPMVDYHARFLDIASDPHAVRLAAIPADCNPEAEDWDDWSGEERANSALSCDHYRGI